MEANFGMGVKAVVEIAESDFPGAVAIAPGAYATTAARVSKSFCIVKTLETKRQGTYLKGFRACGSSQEITRNTP